MAYPSTYDAASFVQDWDIDYAAKTITQQAAGSTGEVWELNHFYIGLMDVMDEILQLDDDPPMDYQTPTQYTLENGWDFGDDVEDIKFLKGGSIRRVSDGVIWANIYTIGTLYGTTNLMVEQNGAVLTQFWSAGHIDILVKVHNGTDYIDSGNLTVLARESGHEFDHFSTTAQIGRNPVPISTANDINDDGSVVGITGISLNYTNSNEDIGDGAGDQPYSTSINCGGNTLADVYKYLKDIVKRGETTLIDSVQGQIYKGVSGLTPIIKKAPFGTFAGGTFFGAVGIWLHNMAGADANNFVLIDNNGVTRNPPVSISISVEKILSGDRVAVFKLSSDDGPISVPYTLNGAHSIGGTTITINEAPSADTPDSGYIRVDGIPYEYSSYSGSVFTLDATAHPTGLAEAHSTGVGVYTPYIDTTSGGISISNTFQYSADFFYRAVVRRGSGADAIKPFEVAGTCGNGGATVTAIRTPNTIINP